MAEEGKKISFGFSKSIKKPALKNVPPVEKKKIDYIECVDEKSIKIVGGEEKKDEPLVIPLLGSKTWHDRIVNKVDADIFEPKVTEIKIKDEPPQDVQIKQEPMDDKVNGDTSNSVVTEKMEVMEIKSEPGGEQPFSLEEQAAREIIADLKSNDGKVKEENVFTVPVANNDDLQGKAESTLEDYENIPIDAFGMAMLRGMGWQPGKGIGKNQKVVPPSIPELRPKGMGLGADKMLLQKATKKTSKEDEQLKLVKGSYVKIIAGKHSDSYGQIEGFDEEAARIIVKLALGNNVVTINEIGVQPVSSSEYSQNSKILNVKKYEEYKKNEASNNINNKQRHKSSDRSEDSDDENHRSRRTEKLKKKSKKRKHQSSDDSSVDRKSKKKRDSSSSSSENVKHKKSKKSKKHKNRDTSSERLSKKNKKRDKEREKTKYKKLDCDVSPKSRRESRSRSYSPRNRRKSRSRSYSPQTRRRSRSRSRSPKTRKRSRSRSRSPRTYRRSRSRTRSPRNSRKNRSHSHSPRNYRRARSRSHSSRR